MSSSLLNSLLATWSCLSFSSISKLTCYYFRLGSFERVCMVCAASYCIRELLRFPRLLASMYDLCFLCDANQSCGTSPWLKDLKFKRCFQFFTWHYSSYLRIIGLDRQISDMNDQVNPCLVDICQMSKTVRLTLSCGKASWLKLNTNMIYSLLK